MLNEVKAGGGNLKQQDGKKEKLVPAFLAHAALLGAWEDVVKIVWDPPAHELNECGRERVCVRDSNSESL